MGCGSTLSRVPSGRSIIISCCSTSLPVFKTIDIGQVSSDNGSPSGVNIFHEPHQRSFPISGSLPQSLTACLLKNVMKPFLSHVYTATGIISSKCLDICSVLRPFTRNSVVLYEVLL